MNTAIATRPVPSAPTFDPARPLPPNPPVAALDQRAVVRRLLQRSRDYLGCPAPVAPKACPG